MMAVACRTILVTLILGAVPAQAQAQNHHVPNRAESEKVVRKTVYEMMKAFLIQDVPVFKRHSAKRTLDLIDLVYDAARKDSRYQQDLQKASINTSGQFLGYFMLGMATQYLQTVPVSPETAAQRVANDSTVSFVSDSEARIKFAESGFARARLVSGSWKIDLADWLKNPVLKEINDPDLRAKIKNL